MADGVDVHPPVAAGLELRLGRTEGEHLALRFVEPGLVDVTSRWNCGDGPGRATPGGW